jgi:hypothetical protein
MINASPVINEVRTYFNKNSRPSFFKIRDPRNDADVILNEPDVLAQAFQQ